MHSKIFGFSVLCLCLFALNFPAPRPLLAEPAEEHQINLQTPKFKEGDKFDCDSRVTYTRSTERTLNKEVEKEVFEMSSESSFTQKVQALDDKGFPSRFIRMFGEVSNGDKTDKRGWIRKNPGYSKKMATFVKDNDGKFNVSLLEGELDESEQQYLQKVAAFDSSDAIYADYQYFLPAKKIKVGETWELDPAKHPKFAAKKIEFVAGKPKGGRGTLEEVKDGIATVKAILTFTEKKTQGKYTVLDTHEMQCTFKIELAKGLLREFHNALEQKTEMTYFDTETLKDNVEKSVSSSSTFLKYDYTWAE